MDEIIIECKGLTKFHVRRENEKLAKNIIKMCRNYGLEVEAVI